MATCFIDEDFTIEVVEDCEVDWKTSETIEEPDIQHYLNMPPEDDEIYKAEESIVGYKCDVCPFTTKHKVIFDNHVESHKQVMSREVRACKCGFITDRKYCLVQHRFECPLKKEKVYRCKYCTFKTFKKAAHNKHMEKLHMKRPSDKNMIEKEK
jgi:hypothetical protein